MFPRFRIPKEVVIKGDVETGLSCVVRGTIEGSLRSRKTVYILQTGVLHGHVRAKKIRIAGTVFGDVHAEKLTVLPGGIVKGKILAGRVEVRKDGRVEDVEDVKPILPSAAPENENQSWF